MLPLPPMMMMMKKKKEEGHQLVKSTQIEARMPTEGPRPVTSPVLADVSPNTYISLACKPEGWSSLQARRAHCLSCRKGFPILH